MARATMTVLIERLRDLLGGDTKLTDDKLLELLDDHTFVFDAPLVRSDPRTTTMIAPFPNIEAGAEVYAGLTVIEPPAYTIDLNRGIVTAATVNTLQWSIRGTAYDLNAAAADGWDLIAARSVGAFDHSANQSSARMSQKYDQAERQAARYRKKAWPTRATVDRADSMPQSQNADYMDGWRENFQ